MREFELLDENGKIVGYRRISNVFGICHDYSYDRISWQTPTKSYECLISHQSVRPIMTMGIGK